MSAMGIFNIFVKMPFLLLRISFDSLISDAQVFMYMVEIEVASCLYK